MLHSHCVPSFASLRALGSASFSFRQAYEHLVRLDCAALRQLLLIMELLAFLVSCFIMCAFTNPHLIGCRSSHFSRVLVYLSFIIDYCIGVNLLSYVVEIRAHVTRRFCTIFAPSSSALLEAHASALPRYRETFPYHATSLIGGHLTVAKRSLCQVDRSQPIYDRTPPSHPFQTYHLESSACGSSVMDIEPALVFQGDEQGVILVRHQNMWRRVLAISQRGRDVRFFLGVAKAKQCGGFRTSVDICETVEQSAIKSANTTAMAALLGNESLSVTPFSARNDIHGLRWDAIAYRRPKPGKRYENLPDTVLIGSIPNVERSCRVYCSRSNLMKFYSRDQIDNFLQPLFDAVQTSMGSTLTWQPRFIRMCTLKVRNRLQNNTKHIKINRGKQGEDECQIAQQCVAWRSETSHECKTSRSRNSTPLFSETNTSLVDNRNRRELDDSIHATHWIMRNEETSLGPPLLNLPTELLLQILENVIENEVALDELIYKYYDGIDPTKEVIRAIPIFAVNKTLRSAVRKLYIQKELVISSRDWKEGDEEIYTVLAKESYPMLQCASKIRMEVTHLPMTVNSPIILQLVHLLRANIILREVVLEWTPSLYYWPRACPENLKRMFLDELFEPLTKLLKQKNVSLRSHYSGDCQESFTNYPRNSMGELPWACMRGSLEVVKYLLDTTDADPEEEDISGGRPLFIAASRCFDNVVDALLETHKVDVNSKGPLYQTALARAAWLGNSGVVKVLLGHKDVDTEARDARGRTPLSLSVAGRNETTVEMLCKHGVNTNSKDNYGETPLCIASSNGDETIVKILLEVASVDPNLRGYNDESALSLAVSYGFERIVKLLCAKRGVDVNLADDNGRTPLMVAVRRSIDMFGLETGRNEILNTLIKTGKADMELADKQGDTALHMASEFGALSIVEAFLASGKVDVNKKGRMNRTPLMLASMRGHAEVVRRLLCENTIDINWIDTRGYCALTIARKDERVNITQCLLNSGKLNARDALRRAMGQGNEWLVQHLLQLGYVIGSRTRIKRNSGHFLTGRYSSIPKSCELRRCRTA